MSARDDRIRALAQKDELTWVECEELATLNGHKLGTPTTLNGVPDAQTHCS